MDTVCAGQAALACDANAWEPQSRRVIADDGIVLGIDGEILAIADSEGGASEQFRPSEPGHPAATLVSLYRRYGVDFVTRLRGHFALAIWDEPAEAFLLISDRFGMRPLYYLQNDTGIAFASEVKALLTLAPAPPPVDERGLCDYILFGIPLDNRTFFTNIQCVPPASILTFRAGQPPTTRRYWELEFHDKSTAFHTIDDAARALKTALQDAVTESIEAEHPIELPLSGGLDTRCIAALAMGTRTTLRTYSLGSQNSEDLRVGTVVAQQLGLPNQAWTLAPRDLMEWTEEAIYLTDGMYNPIDSPILYIARRLPGDARIAIDGASSFDGLYRFFDPFFFRLLPSRYAGTKMPMRALVAPVVRPDGNTIPQVLHPDYEAFAREHALATLNALIESVPPANRSNPFDSLDYLDLRNRLPRCNVMGSVLLRSRCEVRHPFFDPRVIDLVTCFKPFLRAKEKLAAGRLINLAAPELAALVYERTGIPADSPVVRHLLAYGKTALGHATGRFLPFTATKPRVAIDFGSWVQHNPPLQSFIRTLLLDAPASRLPYFDPGALETLLNRLFVGHTACLPLVGRMMSLELWHRYFVEGQSPPVLQAEV
jgi:asparagine synthetase B (glutamine-hydrolysing)